MRRRAVVALMIVSVKSSAVTIAVMDSILRTQAAMIVEVEVSVLYWQSLRCIAMLEQLAEVAIAAQKQ